MSGPSRAALYGLAFCCAVGVLTWLCSLARRDASLADRTWPLAVGGAGIVHVILMSSEMSQRAAMMLLLGAAWALRLGVFVTGRNWGHGEDRRYRDMRLHNEPGFRWKSLYLVFGLQALLAWIVAMPFLVGAIGTRPWGWPDTAGAALTIFGIAFETIGDAQLARFKADPVHRVDVMDRGLWRYTRHPNYFGEFCVWWGLWLMAVHGAGWSGVWSIMSPMLMTLLLLRVSGVVLLEKDISLRRPAYREYVERTNAFFPGVPRRTTR